jgi:hypothetical protein
VPIRATPGGLFVPPPLPPNRTVYPVSGNTASNSNTLGNNSLRLAPFVLPYPTPITALGAEVVGAGEAGSALRMGVYADSGAGLPGALIVQAVIPTDVVAVVDVGASVTLPAGLLWIGGAVQNAPTTQPNVRSAGALTSPILLPFGALGATPGAGTAIIGYTIGAVSGALPAVASAATYSGGAGTVPRVYFRTAA